MAPETTYNVIKVQELRAISTATGSDEIIINDVDSTPLETKKITVENLAYAIKDYVLPIASAEILGGIRVGQGLSINPGTGVLSNDIYYLNDLADVQVLSAQPNQILSYNGVFWTNTENGAVTEVIAGDGLSGGGSGGRIVINVNPGDGIIIENDKVTVNTGLGLEVVNGVILVDINDSLTFQGNQLSVNPGDAIIINENGTSVNYGRGLHLFGPKLEPNLGSGLTFTPPALGGSEGYKIAASLAPGLVFTDSGEISIVYAEPATDYANNPDGRVGGYVKNASVPLTLAGADKEETITPYTLKKFVDANKYVPIPATTTIQGVGEIAQIHELLNAIPVDTDEQLDYYGPRFVTPEGLERWWIEKDESTVTVTFYVCPDSFPDGTKITSDNYDSQPVKYDNGYGGGEVTLTNDPTRPNLSGTYSPTTADTAVTLPNAIAWANRLLRSKDTCIYVLGNGLYYMPLQNFEHVAHLVGASTGMDSFTEANQNFQEENQKPGASSPDEGSAVRKFNEYDMPIFGWMYATYYNSPFYRTFQTLGMSNTLVFRETGSISGVGFESAERNIADSVRWPDVSGTRHNTGNIVAKWMNDAYKDHATENFRYYHCYVTPRIRFWPSNQTQVLSVHNVVSGHGLPGRGGRGSGQDSSLVDIRGGILQIGGLYLLGNVDVKPDDLPDLPRYISHPWYNITGCQHLQALISGYMSDNTLNTIQFPYFYGTAPTPTTNRYDYNINMFHILDRNGHYGTIANKGSANAALKGATFRTIIGVMAPGSKLSTGSYQSYRVQGVPPNQHHGWMGCFGNSVQYSSASIATEYSPISIMFNNSIDTERQPAYVNSNWQQGCTGTLLYNTYPNTVANALNGDTDSDDKPGGIYRSFGPGPVVDNFLNLQTRSWVRGSNVKSGSRNGNHFYG